ncbi:F-box/kelch-repeat protein At1g57790-like [Apium graveolens]|uniref:F-box/kelch-repeat protein At1g57790-like n=1 Tax=Apium graveolens TaxID=4045 RepID=UPI003D7AE528
MNKRCRKGEEDERNEIINNNNTKKTKLLSNTATEARAAAWSELSLDILGEIKKRLYLLDHVRFSSVCKSWLAAQHAKRACDVLPWLLLLDTNRRKVSYYMYQPLAFHSNPVFSHDFYISRILDVSFLRFPYYITYHHGWLLIFAQNNTYSYFLVFSLATNKVIQLPPLNCGDHKLFAAVSTNPSSPDCVFLAFRILDHNKWHISTFRHGDEHWTSTVFMGWFDIPDLPRVKDAVFIRGVFYFLFSNGRIGSYEDAAVDLKVRYYSHNMSNLQDINRKFHKLFVLDQELVVTYYDENPHKLCIRRFDWSEKNWFPLKSLGDRSVFLSKHSVVVDAINSYGVSANKIYILSDKNCSVYSLENGELLNCTSSSGLRNWLGVKYYPELSIRESVVVDKICVWVEPPKLLVDSQAN